MRRLLLIISAIVVLFSCGKKSDSGNEEKKPTISFKFNGKTYEITEGVGLGIYDNRFDRIIIRRPDLFAGIIHFHTNSSLVNNCAYMVPDDQYYMHRPGCILSNNGNPIDSVKVYLFRSGTITNQVSNCRPQRERTAAGTWVEYDLCDITGTFSLTLGNKNNQTIVLSNGTFAFYDFRF